jgi:hypothetical protein
VDHIHIQYEPEVHQPILSFLDLRLEFDKVPRGLLSIHWFVFYVDIFEGVKARIGLKNGSQLVHFSYLFKVVDMFKFGNVLILSCKNSVVVNDGL